MRIVYLKLVNFIGVKAATGLNEIELKYDQVKQPIIQIYGKNRCGKTVMLQQHHPFSSINLTGDERSDLSLIIPNEIGYKEIVYEINGKVYNILHTYKPSGKSHTVSSSLTCNGEELNPSGGVTTFNTLIEKVMGINKYVFQFIINGTNLTSFAGMGSTQRKSLLNKAMGIDIYDKIHKLATDDYRYTNKLISSLNHTKEYLLSTYGTYELLFATLDQKRHERDVLKYELESLKSKLDSLNGKIQTIRQQNPELERMQLDQTRVAYKNAVNELGGFDPNMYESLVNEQIQLNQQLSDMKASRMILLNELDSLYEKLHNIESVIEASRKAKADYDNMCAMIEQLKQNIAAIHITYDFDTSSQYLFGMLSLAQSVNSTCKEIASSLTDDQLSMLNQMVQNDIDINAVLMREGASLMDSEKEKSVISYIHSLLHNVQGDFPNHDCDGVNCIYRNSYDALQNYFKSFQSTSKGKLTRYDLEQMDHASKNLITIKRIINTDIPNILIPYFDIKTIIANVANHNQGIDTEFIKQLIEEAKLQEQRSQYIKQLSDAEHSLELMKSSMIVDDNKDGIDVVQTMIQNTTQKRDALDEQIASLTKTISDHDRKRLTLSSIQKIDIGSIEQQIAKLDKTIASLHDAESECAINANTYQTKLSKFELLQTELDQLEKAFDQYVKTNTEIEQHTVNDERYKAIAEATSSTKGMPVIAIRDTVHRAIATANRLLQVMYDDEIELLKPVIDESSFMLPFRCGGNKSMDIKYGSQSESTLLSLALSLSLASSLTSYKIPLVDEIDAYLDASIRDDFILMLSAMMQTLGIEQMFLISHNLQKGQFEHIVNTIDLSEIISQSKGVE